MILIEEIGVYMKLIILLLTLSTSNSFSTETSFCAEGSNIDQLLLCTNNNISLTRQQAQALKKALTDKYHSTTEKIIQKIQAIYEQNKDNEEMLITPENPVYDTLSLNKDVLRQINIEYNRNIKKIDSLTR
jgi:uncharacterized membrane protein YgaE (UPF0421/DUF939 family)